MQKNPFGQIRDKLELARFVLADPRLEPLQKTLPVNSKVYLKANDLVITSSERNVDGSKLLL